MAFIIYGKAPHTKNFKAMDLNEGLQVSNLIYATLIYETEDKLKSYVKDLTEQNKDWQFKYKEA